MVGNEKVKVFNKTTSGSDEVRFGPFSPEPIIFILNWAISYFYVVCKIMVHLVDS